MVDLVKDEYYCVTDERDKSKYLIFKFDGTYHPSLNQPNYYYLYSNMCSHWDKYDKVFMRPDGTSSYPYEFRLRGDEKKGYHQSFVSIRGRKVRPATQREILLLEACHESNMTITIEEFRNILLETIGVHE